MENLYSKNKKRFNRFINFISKPFMDLNEQYELIKDKIGKDIEEIRNSHKSPNIEKISDEGTLNYQPILEKMQKRPDEYLRWFYKTHEKRVRMLQENDYGPESLNRLSLEYKAAQEILRTRKLLV